MDTFLRGANDQNFVRVLLRKKNKRVRKQGDGEDGGKQKKEEKEAETVCLESKIWIPCLEPDALPEMSPPLVSDYPWALASLKHAQKIIIGSSSQTGSVGTQLLDCANLARH
eukprot:scaffold170855_cov13-Tisochrysis_lutea.AAC.1